MKAYNFSTNEEQVKQSILHHFNSHAATSTSLSQTSDNEDTDEVTLEQISFEDTDKRKSIIE